MANLCYPKSEGARNHKVVLFHKGVCAHSYMTYFLPIMHFMGSMDKKISNGQFLSWDINESMKGSRIWRILLKLRRAAYQFQNFEWE